MLFFDTSDLKDQEIYLRLYKTADEDTEKGYVPAYLLLLDVLMILK